ncbi:MAG: hypothetical protein LBC91_03755, partial [Candidatus Accumulibacter sp.]|nr:hypothetical protein [Accumulibacter sp.]
MKRGNGGRAAGLRRFAAASLLPFIAPPAARRLARALVWGFWIVYFLFILLILSLRYAILPRIENHRPAIERMIAESIGRKVSIGRIEAGWADLHPDLTLYDVGVADAEGRPALSFARVEMVLSWRSVIGMRLRLLRIDQPTLHVRRAGDGRFFVAGFPLGGVGDGGGDGGKGASWVLTQRRIRIDDATLVWEDEARGAPALVLADAHLVLDNDGRRHRFGLTAQPPGGIASRIDVRGDFTGDFDRPDKWRGRAFAELGYVDLAAWKQWVDYPVALPRGDGAARAWLTFADGKPRELTADVALRETDLKFGEELPALNLESLSGRVQASFQDDGLAVKGDEIALRSRADEEGSIRLGPTDFDFTWQKGEESGASAGRLEIDRLDLGALTRLAARLPFGARPRQTFADFAPHGQVSALTASWSVDA